MIRYYMLLSCSTLFFLFSVSNYINLDLGRNLNGLWRAYEVHPCGHEKPSITERNLKITANQYNITLMSKGGSNNQIIVYESNGCIDAINNNKFSFTSYNAVLNQSYQTWLNTHLYDTKKYLNTLEQGQFKVIYQNLNLAVIEFEQTHSTVIYTKLT